MGQILYVGFFAFFGTVAGFCEIGPNWCKGDVRGGAVNGGIGLLAVLLSFGLARGVLRHRMWALRVVAAEITAGAIYLIAISVERLVFGRGSLTMDAAEAWVVIGGVLLLLAAYLATLHAARPRDGAAPPAVAADSR